MMRKRRILSVIAAAVLSATMLASCGDSDSTIAVISREDGSGTRGAFIELTGVEEKDKKNDNKRIFNRNREFPQLKWL